MNINSAADVEQIFTYHKPFGTQAERYERIRAWARDGALMMLEICPPSRERSLAMSDLQRLVQMANSSIAINEKEPIAGPVADVPNDAA